MIDDEREPYDRERAIALLSYGDCVLTKELANEIADDMRSLIAERDTAEANLERLQNKFEQVTARIVELEAVVREAYEVWAGSEGLMQPATAPEAYFIMLIEKMAIILGKALASEVK
jgi:hypothetical protein